MVDSSLQPSVLRQRGDILSATQFLSASEKEAAINAAFSGRLDDNAAKPKSKKAAEQQAEKEADGRLYQTVSGYAAASGLTLNNLPGTKINPQKLVVILGGPPEENAQRQNYKFGEEEVPDRKKGAPLSITIPYKTPYAQVDAFMKDIRKGLLKNQRFESLYVESHGAMDGWVGTFEVTDEEVKFLNEYNIFKTMTPYKTAEDAPFYLHTKHLRLAGCGIFSDLTEKEVSYLRNLASGYKVRIDGNTSDGFRCWGMDENGQLYAFKKGDGSKDYGRGPGGNAYAFMPDRTVQKIKRPLDKDSFEGSDWTEIDTTALEKAWTATGKKVIDQRKAPYQITYGAVTLTYFKK